MLSITPPAEELLPNHKVKCTQHNCESVFTNMGNYELHLQKKHNVTLVKLNKSHVYYCPDKSCIYNVASNHKHFKNLKYLRQHYQKVHMPKSHICEHCGKGFPTVGRLFAHTQKECGVKHVCGNCGLIYKTNEALLTHIKRKRHYAEHKSYNTALQQCKVGECASKQKTVCNNVLASRDQQTQTEDTDTSKTSQIGFSQTESFCFNADTSISNDLNDIQSILCDIETQTETSQATNLDMMFSQSSDIHTQTCNDFFSDLGFADIQTQTNWSTFPLDNDRNPYVSSANTTNSYIQDELLVSTETQTSFTQCLLDSTANASENSFGSLYNTQHTQTCHSLLDGLFGVQDNDLIGNFQSTTTQT